MIRNDNRGISLVEVLLVISILALFASGGISLYRQLSHADCKRAAARIQTAMEEVRMETISRGRKPYLYLYQLEGTYYLKKCMESNPTAAKLDAASGNRISEKLSLSYQLTASAEVVLEEGKVLQISFHRGSGSFDQDLERIILRSSEFTTEIVCVPETGRHWVEQ